MGFRPLEDAVVADATAEGRGFRSIDETGEPAVPLVARIPKIAAEIASAASSFPLDVGAGAANFFGWPLRAGAAAPVAAALTPFLRPKSGITGERPPIGETFRDALAELTDVGHLPYVGQRDIPVGGEKQISIGEVPEYGISKAFEKIFSSTKGAGEKVLDVTGSPKLATATETGLDALAMALGRTRAVPGRSGTGTEVSTYIKGPEPSPVPSSIDQWLARRAQERAGPIQDVTEVGGIPAGQNLIVQGAERDAGNVAPAIDAGRAEAGGGDRLQQRPPEVGYTPYPGLNPDERTVETRFATQLSENRDEAIQEYKSRFGNVISTDLAKELSPDYVADKTQYSRAAHEPASALVKEIYSEELKKSAPEGKTNTVVFTAGGTGAGKTTAINANGFGSLADSAQIVYDSNMNGYESSKSKIDQALDAGKDVAIIYVYRDPVKALVGQPGMGGALSRAAKIGRTVPIDEHAKTHVGSRETVQRLANEYGSNPNVSIYAISNEAPGVRGLRPIEAFPKHEYNELHGRLQTALDQERAAGRVSDKIYEASSRGQAVERPARAAGAQESQRGAEEVAQVGVQAADLVRRDSKGRIIGGFGANIGEVRQTLRRMESLSREGEVGRGWYKDSGQAILKAVGGDREAALRIAQVLAITSAGTEIKANLTMTAKALEQYARGEPIKVATGQKNKAIEDLLYHGIVPDSVKVDDFYTNLAAGITGAEVFRPVTDRWQFRIATKGEREVGSRQQYEHTSALAAQTARKLGWPVEETQAAMWVAMKARAKYAAMKESVAQSKDSKYAGVPDAELKRIALESAKVSFGSEIAVRGWKPPEGIKFPSIEELREAHQILTAEVKPSTKTEIGKRASGMSGKDLEAFQKQALATVGGADGFLRKMGLGPTAFTTHPGGGAYEGGIAPNMIASIRAPKEVVDRVAKAWMYVFKQDAVPYFRAGRVLVNDANATRGVYITAADFTATQEKQFYEHLRKEVDPGIGYTRDGNTFMVMNFHGQDVQQFLEKMDAALKSPDNPLKVESAVDYGAQSEYPYHDWEKDPEGKDLLDQASSGGSPDLQPWLRDRANAFQRFADENLPAEELRKAAVGEPRRLAQDAPDQVEFLNSRARDLGYADADSLHESNPRAFSRLAEEWRNEHELEVGVKGEGIDRIAVSTDEPTGKLASLLENEKFEPAVYLERYQRNLIPLEKTTIAAAVKDLIDAGVPEHFMDAISGFTASISGTVASYNTVNRTVSVSGIMSHGDSLLRGYLAHELTHAVDHVETSENKTKISNFISATSTRLEVSTGFDVMTGGMSILWKGDISKEIIDSWSAEHFRGSKNSLEIANFFDYPLAADFPSPRLYSLELFAQMGRLYITNPELMRSELPIAYSAMKEIYDNAGTTVEETRDAIRAALQTPGAAPRAERGVGREPEQGRLFEAAQRSARERGAGERVVGVQAPAEHGGRAARVDQTGVQAGGGRKKPPGGGVPATQGPNPYWDVDQPGLRDNLTRAWQNNQIDLKKTQEAIERAAGTITEKGDAYLAEELYRDRVTSRVKRAYKNQVEPILKDIKDAGLTVDETSRYLWARHAPERNTAMEKINPGETGLSGLSNKEASQILASFSPEKRTALDGIGEKIDALTASTRQILVKEGLEGKDTIAAWEGAYKHYVPLFRDIDETGTGSGFQVRGPESKRAMGSHREAQAVLAAVIAQHERAIVRAEKAKVGRALIKLAEDHPNPDFWRVDTPPQKRTVNPSTGLVQTGVDPLYRQRDDVFIVKDRDASGKVVERVLAFNPKNERAVQIAKAMKNLDVVQLSAVTNVVGKVTRVLANLATSWNPAFWTTNAVRDVQTAAVNLQSTPLAGRAPSVIANIPRAIGGILSAEFRDGKGKWATAYREFEKSGGKMEWGSIFNDLLDRQKELASQINASQRSNINPVKWGQKALEIVEKMNSAIENATRLSAFVEGVDRGMSPAKSASLAKNMTVNFRRKGTQSTGVGAWYMFFNANVQGTARMISGLSKSRRAQAIVGTMVAFGAALELLNRMIGEMDQDEDGNNAYELLGEDFKQKSMVFMIPKSGGNYVSFPLAYGFNVFHNMGRMMMESILSASDSRLVDEKKKPGEQAWNFAKTLIDAFMPLGNTTTPAQFIAPSVLDPAVQYAENKNWAGYPLRPEPQSFGPATPNHKLYFRNTSDTAKDLTKWLSDLTGGDDVRGGSIDISPTTIAHIAGTAGGGTGRFGLGMLDFTNHMVNRIAGEEKPEDMSWRAVPFVGKFYGEVEDRDKASKFYRLRAQAMDVWKQMETYRKLREYDKAAQVEEENPALAAMARELVTKDFKKEMTGAREQYKVIDEMPRGEREAARRDLRAEENSIMSRAIRAYNEAAQEQRR